MQLLESWAQTRRPGLQEGSRKLGGRGFESEYDFHTSSRSEVRGAGDTTVDTSYEEG